jgi:hypothetical protein
VTADRIVLTIPGEDGFEGVAQLVLAGVAARLDLTYEVLDDLGTALGTLLERRAADGELTVELEVRDATVAAALGPFSAGVLSSELGREYEGVGLRRVLETVVDRFAAIEREDGDWIELEKRVDRVENTP